jgi:hypothetical protein
MGIYDNRFPIEPASDKYTPNQYNINSSGYPPFYDGSFIPDDTPPIDDPDTPDDSTDIYVVSGEYKGGNIQLSRNDN